MGKSPPSFLLASFLAIIIAIFALAVWLAASMPKLGIDVDVGRKGQLVIVAIDQPSQTIALPATLISMSSSAQSGPPIILNNDHHLISETQTAPQQASVNDQDQLLSMVRQGPVVLELRDARGQRVKLIRSSTGQYPLSARFWLLSFAGLVCAIISAWVFALRPNLLAAQAIAVIGISLLGVSLPIATTFASDFIVGGQAYLWAQVVNYSATQTFATSLIILFSQYSQKLITGKAIFAILIIFLSPLGFFAALWPDASAMYEFGNIMVLVDLVAIAAVTIAQWGATRRDPVGRAYIQLVGASWVIVLAIWIALFIVPVLLGSTPALDFAFGMWLMVPPFFAMAYGIAKGFMFEASTWAGRLLLSAATLLALIGVDLGLVFAVGADAGFAASGALFIVGTVWILARTNVIRQVFGKKLKSDADLFDQAVSIALAHNDNERAIKWQSALRTIFEPLIVDTYSEKFVQPSVVNGGLGLSVPAMRFAAPVVLSNKRNGTQVFTQADVKIVSALKAMCDRIDSDRDGYDRGKRAERIRIARDLHDDVSARLLTSLHRTQTNLMQADVREALSDIRAIVTGLEGNSQTLLDAIATIRVEFLDRLEAATIKTDWPLTQDTAREPILLDYQTYRNLHATMREIASNIVRHSKATCVFVTVSLTASDGNRACYITIQDNGIGVTDKPKTGHGLSNIASRMSEVGGSVAYKSDDLSPELTGMRLTLNFPLPP